MLPWYEVDCGDCIVLGYNSALPLPLDVLFKEHIYDHVVRPVLKVENFHIGKVRKQYCLG